jgi:hypothetical protein
MRRERNRGSSADHDQRVANDQPYSCRARAEGQANANFLRSLRDDK